MSMAMTPGLIRIDLEVGDTGRLYATSPDLKGLLVGRRTIQELEVAIPAAIRDLFEAAGEAVTVNRVTDGEHPQSLAWVALPAAEAVRPQQPA